MDHSAYGIFPKNEIGRVSKTEIVCFAQTFADIATFSKFSSSFVFLFLGRTHF